MTRMLKTVTAIVAAAGLAVGAAAQDPVRYEAEDAVLGSTVPPDQYEPNPKAGEVIQLSSASGGSYVAMNKSEKLTFTIDGVTAGFYQVTARYSNTAGDNGRVQNVFLNGSSLGTVAFPVTHTSTVTFADIVIASKAKFVSGVNTFEIRHNWGNVDFDYIELAPYEETPFNLTATLVTPNPLASAQKMYDFMRENFTQKVISGVMTGYDLNNGYSLKDVPEMKQAFEKSGKYPALLGLDFLFSTGQAFNADLPNWGAEGWYYKQTKAVLDLAEELFNEGGIPHLMWHWRDPSKTTDNFYTPSGSGNPTNFDFRQAFNSGTTQWNTSSAIYDSLIADIDRVSDYLKTLDNKGVPVLWRPLHEAAGGWFWWGVGKDAQATKALYILMFERMVNHHQLKNLIWVWTCEEGGDALEWYPGDQYVDIIGRDIYHWPNAESKQEYGSLVSNFENLKSLYNASKIIALTENGSIPDPDGMFEDGAYWSFFMPWNGGFLSGANSNEHWNKVMNHDKVLTLDEMPGWGDGSSVLNGNPRASTARVPTVTVRGKVLNVVGVDNSEMSVRLVNLRGKTIARYTAYGRGSFSLAKVPAGRYVVETRIAGKRVGSSAVVVR